LLSLACNNQFQNQNFAQLNQEFCVCQSDSDARHPRTQDFGKSGLKEDKHNRPTNTTVPQKATRFKRPHSNTFIISQHQTPKRPTHLMLSHLASPHRVSSQTSIDKNNQRSLRVHSCPDQASSMAISKPTQPRSLARSLQPSAVRSRQTIS
jgi:hypothetical protein